MQRAVHMFKRVGTAWIMSGLRMLRSCITTNNWAQRSSDVFGVCESGMVGGADLSHMFRNLEKLTQLPSNCHSWEVPSLKLHWASKTSHPRTPLKVNASHALIVQYAVKWCGATIISYSTPAFLTRHCKPEYIRICLELDALQQVNIAVITPICAFDLCVCTVSATIKAWAHPADPWNIPFFLPLRDLRSIPEKHYHEVLVVAYLRSFFSAHVFFFLYGL